MQYKFNPIYNKKPYGASEQGEEVKYCLQILKQINSTHVYFCFQKDFDNSTQKVLMASVENGEYIKYTASVKYQEACLYWYYFEVWQGNHKFYLQYTENFEVEPTGEDPNKFQQTVVQKTIKPNKDFCGGIIYHIFVDRFCKDGDVKARGDLVLRKDWGGNITKYTQDFVKLNKECFGGNIKGIIKKLDYIKSLGVNTIYLSPIFEANSYHKYNTADYFKIDSMFGDEKDFKTLVEKAKELDVHIILDGVFNHVGSDSIYFNKYNTYNSVGAYNSKKSKYINWFDFENYPNKYSSWWGIESLPQIKKECPDFRNFITGKKGVIETYMNMGILGFRLDVADELNDNMLDKIKEQIKHKKNSMIIGEVWENASNKIAYSSRRKYFTNNQLDSVMNYPLKDAIINYLQTKNCNNLLKTIYMIKDNYPKNIADNLMNILGTHDTSRIMSVIKNIANKDEVKTLKLFKLATLLQFTLFGVPCIFYGDEIGLMGEGAPYCRVCFDWKSQNKNLQNWYKFLAELRSDPVFAGGELNIQTTNKATFVFDRTVGYHKIVVCINAGDTAEQIALDGFYKNYASKKNVNKTQTIPPLDFKIFYR
ncbi:MAG: glycoside hydrolase family 13 protein [Clostridia bacterium]|nr:glycoside hydrolase family 13 protein [Clostridia bacterium]